MGIENSKEDMRLVIVGHVDHGKSTIIGRLLADTHSLPEGKLEFVKEMCKRNAKPFEYAFLLDALKDERSQGITIDSARCFFKTQKRNYLIFDAPGHIEFLKNMVTGAAGAEAALLVIDATEGIRENSRRHGYLLSMLGIGQISVLVNKMDLVDYQESVFRDIAHRYSEFLEKLGVVPNSFSPVSGMEGDNIAELSPKMNWYQGPTVLEVLDGFEAAKLPGDKPFRMPVQGVYKFTLGGDNRRIVGGTIESGKLSVGDEVVFYPSGKKSTVASIEAFNKEPQLFAEAGYATGFTLKEQIYITRGEVATVANQIKPSVTTRMRVNLFWLGKQPLEQEKDYLLKIGTAKVGMKLETILRVIDASTLDSQVKEQIDRNDVAECILKLEKAVAFDLAQEISSTGRFAIVDDYEISGGGIFLEALEDEQSLVREKVLLRNFKWETSMITPEQRAEKYNQKSTLILITGPKDVGKKAIAKALEKKLFGDGKIVYFLGIGNILYGVDADIKSNNGNHKEEHLRRLAEVSHILLDAGAILIVTAVELSQEDLEVIQTILNLSNIETVWVGDKVTTDIGYDLHLSSADSVDNAVNRIKTLLQERGIIYKPW
jgi:bifunctional enzyme CysN/CysC